MKVPSTQHLFFRITKYLLVIVLLLSGTLSFSQTTENYDGAGTTDGESLANGNTPFYYGGFTYQITAVDGILTGTDIHWWESDGNGSSAALGVYGNGTGDKVTTFKIKKTDGNTFDAASIWVTSFSSTFTITGYNAGSATTSPINYSADGVMSLNFTSIDELRFEGTDILIDLDDFQYTLLIPTVTTESVSNITISSATGNGNITALGKTNPTQHGVCWSTAGNPTINNDKTEDGAVSATGAFTSSITGLTPVTTYYVRAYATNTLGTSYGSQTSFITTMPPPGNALDFDGINESVTVPDNGSLKFGAGAFTIEAWIKNENTPGTEWNRIVVKRGTSNTPIWYSFNLLDNRLTLELGGGTNFSAEPEIQGDGIWHHVAAVRDGTTIHLYIDGIQYSDTNASYGTNTDNSDVLEIGTWGLESHGSEKWIGQIDEVRIWNDARTPEEIRTNMKNVLAGNEANLVAYYKFDHISGNTLLDMSDNNNTGTLQNMEDEDWNASGAMIYPPTALSVTSKTTSSFSAEWKENYTATKYYMDVATDSEFSSMLSGYNNKEINGGATVSLSVTGLTVGTYYYRLRVFNENTSETSVNSNTVSVIILAPEIVVKGNTTEIADGDDVPTTSDHTGFGSIDINTAPIIRIFTIENTGTSLLTLGANAVTLSGPHVADYTVSTQPATTVVAGSSTTFRISFNPSVLGLRIAEISIANDDSDENPYNFAIEGTRISAPPTISIDNSTLAYSENDIATQIDPAATVNDADGDADWDGGTLEVQITANNEAADEISIPDNVVGTINTSGTTILNATTAIGVLSASEGTITNSTKLTITFNANVTNALVQQVLRALHYRNTSDDPGTLNRTITFIATDKNAASASGTRTISVTAVNDEPTLTNFAGVVETTDEDTQEEITFAELAAQGNEADSDGTVTEFIVKSVSSGTLMIGTSAGTASAWASGTNDVIDASNNAYWTPSSGANGTLNAFVTTVKDNDGGESTTANVIATVLVNDINDLPTLTSYSGVVETTDEDTQEEITFAELAAQGNEADSDGTVTEFIVKSVSSGTLMIGTSAGTATAWASGTNDVIDATNNAYWTPASGANGTLNAFVTTVKDNDGGESTTANVIATVLVNDINDLPTLTSYSGVVETTDEDTQEEITFAELAAQGNEADSDGTVTEFIVKSVSSGTLMIGTSAGTASAWASGTNDVIDATNNAYWTPAFGANGTLNAFVTTVKDNDGGESTTANVIATVLVNDINDLPTLTSYSGVVETTDEDTQEEITFAELAAQGNEADSDGTVTEFIVKSVSSGTLMIGTSAGTASAWASGTNDVIDASNNAYWTPASGANGTLNAFVTTVKDNDGGESTTANVAATVTVNDVIAPLLLSSTPSNNVTNTILGANIVLHFDDNMVVGTGNITLKNASDNSVFEQFDINDPEITISTNQLTINPVGIFFKGTEYYIEIDATALDDDAGNSFAGISGNSTLNFTAVDVVINEVVIDPQQDWSTNGFNGTINAGAISSGTDEWIELLINSDGIDLSGWTLELLDGTNIVGDLSNTGAFDVSNYLGSGSFASTISGDYLVLGDVDGSGAMNNSGLTINLKDPGGAIVDAVVIGGGAGGAPSGYPADIYSETVQRYTNGLDTDIHSNDFTLGMASMGSANIGPSVTLSTSPSSITEAAGISTITATLSAASSQNVIVTIAVDGSSTAAPADYTLSSTSILIIAGSTIGTASLTATQDLADENNETVIVNLIGVTNGTENGTQQQTVTINDDDATPTIAFNAISSNGSETLGSANLQVDLSAASGLIVTVDYTVTGTASGADFTLADGILTISAGEANDNITIASIVNDLLDENNETVIVTLSSPTNASLGTNMVHTYTINDNDATPTIAFNAISSNGSETLGSADLQVDLSAASGLIVTVDYTVTGTASGADFTLADGILTISAGEANDNITIASIVNDLLDENNETVIVTLSSPTNASLGTNRIHTYTINDNDSSPVVTASQIFSVDEDAANATVVGTVLATDADAGTILSNWIITGGNADTIFIINASTGEITVNDNTNLDFEATISYIISITVSDGVNTSLLETVSINVNDINESPTAVCQDITVYLDESGNVSIAAREIDGGSTDDNTLAEDLLFSVNKDVFDCDDIGGNIITLEVTNNTGGSSTCSATVTVFDTISPTANCKNITAYLDATGNVSIDSVSLDNGSGDACGIESFSLDIFSFDCSDVGPNAVEMTVTDVNGNESSCSSIVTIMDTIAYEAICRDIEISLNEEGSAKIYPSFIDNGSTDSGGIAFYSLDISKFNCSDIGENTVVLSVRDVCGNVSTCNSTVTVSDNWLPEVTCKDIDVFLNAEGVAIIDSSMIDNGSSALCGISGIELSKSIFTGADLGENSVTMTVTNRSGITASGEAKVTVKDTIAPVALCNSIDIWLSDNANYVLSEDDIFMITNGSSDNATPYDNLQIEITPTTFNCSQVGDAITIEVSISDMAGNKTACQTIVYVNDSTEVQLGLLEDIEIGLVAGECEILIDYPEVFTAQPCATFVQLEGLGADSMFPLGTTIETWEVTYNDVKDTVSFSVIVTSENAVPTIASVSDVIVNEDSSVSVDLSGISGGDDCMVQDVIVTAGNKNTALVTGIEVDYTTGGTVGILNITLAANASGSDTISVVAEDSEGAKITASFVLTVNPVNDSPFLVHSLSDQTVTAAQTFDFSLSKLLGVLFDDVDDITLIYTVRIEGDVFPDWITAAEDADMYMLNFAPLSVDTGCYNIIVEAADLLGAVASDTFELYVDKVVGINDLGNDVFEISMYPNPSKGMVTIEANGINSDEVEITVMNVGGKKVFRKKYRAGDPVQINLSGEVSGMYMVLIEVDGQRVVKKLILDRK